MADLKAIEEVTALPQLTVQKELTQKTENLVVIVIFLILYL